MSGDGFVFIPGGLTEPALERALSDAHGREAELLLSARARVVAWSWCEEHMLAYRPEPFFAERFDRRTPPERAGEPSGRAIRFGRDADGVVALVDIGDLETLETDRGLRFEAWHTASEGVLLDQNSRVLGVQRRVVEDGRVRAHARLTAAGRRPPRYEAESYDYDDHGHLSGIRSASPSAWSQFYMQVISVRGRRETIAFAPRWAVEHLELSDDALDQLEERLRAAAADRVLRQLAKATIDDEIHYVALYGPPIQYHLLYATEKHRSAVWARRRYRPFDFYLHDRFDDVTEELPDRGFGDLAADYELLNRELIKRRQQPRLQGFTAQVARILNARPWPANLRTVPEALCIARGLGTRQNELRMIRQSMSHERWAALEEQENAKAQEHATSRSMTSIPRRSAETKLRQLARDAGYKKEQHDATTPSRLFEVFVQFLAIPITGVEHEHDDVLFEVRSADPGHADVVIALVRQLSLYDRDENYLGMETISIELLFPAGGSAHPPNDTIWADHDRPGSWPDDVRKSTGFKTLLDGRHTAHTILFSSGPV